MSVSAPDRKDPHVCSSDWPAGTPRVSIVIVTYNALDCVKACLEGIRARTGLPHEVIVVDNASRPNTRAYLRTVPWIRLIQNEENRLWSPACNQGMAAVHPGSEFVLLLNSDIEILRDNWLETLLVVMAAEPNVGIVGPHHIRRRAGPLFGTLNGDCFMIRRRVLDEVGPFDEAYPWAGANQLFTIEAWRRGWIYKVLHRADRVVHHRRHQSRQADSDADARIRATPRSDYLEMLRRAGIAPELPSPVAERVSRLLGRRVRSLWSPRRFYHARPSAELAERCPR